MDVVNKLRHIIRNSKDRKHIENVIENLYDQINYTLDLPDKIVDTLRWYTTYKYKDFLNNLRNKIYSDIDSSEKLYNINKAFENVMITNKTFVVYRGINKSPNKSLSTVISTSMSIEQASTFANDKCCLLEIEVSKGSRVIPVFIVSEIMEELEIILDSNAIFKVNDYPSSMYNGIEVYKAFYYSKTYNPEYVKIFDINRIYKESDYNT
jgi:hypothetical protein